LDAYRQKRLEKREQIRTESIFGNTNKVMLDYFPIDIFLESPKSDAKTEQTPRRSTEHNPKGKIWSFVI
jgi:hypothetical protein